MSTPQGMPATLICDIATNSIPLVRRAAWRQELSTGHGSAARGEGLLGTGQRVAAGLTLKVAVSGKVLGSVF